MQASVVSGAESTLERSHQVDEAVRQAFERVHPPVTVAAVGGYGRRELFPYSDVDLLLLTGGPVPSADRERISEFLRILWDRGLRVSQSVHTPAECCEIHDGNLELTISLLDRRQLCGDPARYDELTRLFPKFLNSERNDIASHLRKMTDGRHARYGNTIYHLEPNVKEHPGSLRDLQVIHWLQQLRTFETDPLDQARAFLFDVRIRLHQFFGRDNNLLSFEAQEHLSENPGAWMREYYRHARQIDRAAQRALEASESGRAGLLSQFRDWRSRLSTTEFSVLRERVLLRNSSLLQTEPAAAMRLMTFIARHQLRLAPGTETRLTELERVPCSWAELRELFRLPRCVNALRAMADLGLLRKIIPEWSRIDCLVVRDFYHRYTVDEHTLVTLQVLEDLAASGDPGQAHLAQLLREIDSVELLRMALLLHDIGKGEGEEAGPHSLRSLTIAREVLERLNAPEQDRDTILFLIEHHLVLSSLMTSRDLTDPATAAAIAASTGTLERLKLLALLTYADISAVNPAAMTPWRLERLWQAYVVGHEALTWELASQRIHDAAQTSPEEAAFLEGLPTRYLKTHTRAEIVEHVEMARHVPAVQLTRMHGSYRITVVAADRPFLLAAISGALASFGMNILKAEAFANLRGQIVDTFVFEDPHRTLDLNPGETERLENLVTSAVLGRVDIARLMQKRRRAAGGKRRVEPTVSFENEVSDAYTLIEIAAEDRPGLLYDLTYSISSAGASIEVVLIDTEAHRALDVFYVSKLSSAQMTGLKAKLLEAVG